jgi:Tfp pilus assembly protein PilX
MNRLLLSKQRGAATLFTAIIILIGITLIALLVAKAVLVETQMTADNYRTSQASAAASAAMDRAVAYYTQGGGIDHDFDGTPDFIESEEPGINNCVEIEPVINETEGQITLTSGTQTTLAQYYFNNADDNICDNPNPTACTDEDGDTDGDCFGLAGTNMTRALITAKGWSDDCTAERTITQCVAPFRVFNGSGGPEQPFITRAAVGAFGNATIINRYNNTSIWAGGTFGTPDVAFGTYLRPSGTEIADYTEDQLDSDDEESNTQLVSSRNSGQGLDIITNDATLSSKTADQFFELFFNNSKTETKNAAASADPSQLLTPSDSLNGKTGLIWVEGDKNISGTTIIGDYAHRIPAIVIINGNLNLTGGEIYGALYVTGTISIAGNPVVRGSIIGESGTPSTGAGTLRLVYVPLGGNTNAPPQLPGTGAVVAGSWKDW